MTDESDSTEEDGSECDVDSDSGLWSLSCSMLLWAVGVYVVLILAGTTRM